jgi:aconitate hydratase
MLGQPISLLVPEVVGFRLRGSLPEGATATDLVLTVTETLRKKGVVGKFVEFFGDGIASLSLADRATIGNMSPEYGATCAIFPIDAETIAYLRFSGRSPERVALVETYAKAQGFFRTAATPDPLYTDTLELDLATVVPSLAGPSRPQDRVPLAQSKELWRKALPKLVGPPKKDASQKAGERRLETEGGNPAPKLPASDPEDAQPGAVRARLDGHEFDLAHGSVVIAAITSCTNTSNPSVMIGAGLLAQKAVERGLESKPWVKTSLAPGSKVVTEYLRESGLMPALEKLNFHLVGYGCTTCIGNSGPLPEPVSDAIRDGGLVAVAVLSGNRNFEGRINPDVRANYLASPPLVVAYALAGRMDIDLYREPLGRGRDGEDVFLRDIWPSPQEVRDTLRSALTPEMFAEQYADVFRGDEHWQTLEVPTGDRFAWDPGSTYVRRPTFFDGMTRAPQALRDIDAARVLVLLGDSVTTDHISPAGSIPKASPAGAYLIEHGVSPADFNAYGARRGNHEVMVRGTFANVRLRNLLAPGTEGGWTRHLPDGETMTIYDASVRYQKDGVPLLVIAGKEYGSGSSRDWAAKGPYMLGIRAVIAESFERIHRSNLIGMGILPLQFAAGQNCESLRLDGTEQYRIGGVSEGLAPGRQIEVVARTDRGAEKRFEVQARIDTPVELDYYRHGGILHFMLRQLL